MIRRILILLGFSLSMMFADNMTFYIGTYTSAGTPGGIWKGSFDPETGKLSIPTLVAKTTNPTFLAWSPTHQTLYAALEQKDGAVQAWFVETKGNLRLLNSQSAKGGSTCYVSVDPTGNYVLAANYTSGSVGVFPIQPDGSLRESSDWVAFTGSGPSPRQDHAYGHAFDTRDGFAYACDLGSDSLWSFQFDSASGRLKPLNPPDAKLPAGSGPRHLIFDKSGRFAYAINELLPGVTTFARDLVSGQLTPLQTLSTLPPGVSAEGVTAAEIVLHPNGKWLYASNRHVDSLTVYAVAADGTLSWIENVPSGVRTPRSFTIAPGGRWLLVAGQDDHRILVFQLDPATGKLSATSESEEVPHPVCVLFTEGD